jgi:hypothetical protein
MNNFPRFYPSSPRKVPAGLTEPSAPFRKQVHIAAFSLLLFFLMYFGLILALTMGIVYCAMTPDRGFAGRHSSWNTTRWILAIIMLAPLVILIKNLFHKQKPTKGYEVEVFEREHPQLFDFLRCVCAETGAPMPDRVLINHQINAAAGCEVSLASLIKPPERMLILGLGLINVLNMTEFVIFPELTHLPAGRPLRPFLLKGSLEDMPSHFDESIRYKWLERFAKQFQDVEKRLNRLHFKSLGNILALQERIGASADKL